MACVYKLAAERLPDDTRYIGRTSDDTPEERLKSHFHKAKQHEKQYVWNWIRSVWSKGDNVIVTVVESNLTWEQSGKREKSWIAYYRYFGYKLTNMTDGGDGILGYRHTEEEKSRRREASTGRWHSEETKQKCRIGNLGKVMSEESKAKMRVAKIGVPMKDETRRKISVTLTGTQQPWSKERRLAYGKLRTGEKRSEETKQKIREKALKSWEQRKKIS